MSLSWEERPFDLVGDRICCRGCGVEAPIADGCAMLQHRRPCLLGDVLLELEVSGKPLVIVAPSGACRVHSALGTA